ncbi:dehydrogenase/reductase (sdr family) member 4 [Holotrichia oblita]|uniref:Dehydrogenase/reductase (Sdr family) member 4 n=1 Tax=Holotrichia oblita TaxID=644536 RepID=A0ACB9TUF5_HOLOL|nr:dehydrogenase/reductase (sdr family) member 4 [Holotrichia oblita]
MLIKQVDTKVVKKLTGILNTFRYVSYIPRGRLDGKVAVVTASTDGIGYGIAERLAKEGAKVVISSRKQKNVDQALEKLKSHKLDVCGLVCHVGNPEDRKRLYNEVFYIYSYAHMNILQAIKQYGGINILVSNAAVNPAIGGVLELLGAYSVSKTALLALTKTAALQLANKNITVNCIAPGIVKTKFAQALTANEELEKESLGLIPMGRFGKPEDIAGAVAFLVSEDANYITGETIVVAGGSASRL